MHPAPSCPSRRRCRAHARDPSPIGATAAPPVRVHDQTATLVRSTSTASRQVTACRTAPSCALRGLPAPPLLTGHEQPIPPVANGLAESTPVATVTTRKRYNALRLEFDTRENDGRWRPEGRRPEGHSGKTTDRPPNNHLTERRHELPSTKQVNPEFTNQRRSRHLSRTSTQRRRSPLAESRAATHSRPGRGEIFDHWSCHKEDARSRPPLQLARRSEPPCAAAR